MWDGAETHASNWDNILLDNQSSPYVKAFLQYWIWNECWWNSAYCKNDNIIYRPMSSDLMKEDLF
jgi:hypothetical protein